MCKCPFTHSRSNELALVPVGTQPRHRFVEPKLTIMEQRIEQLDTVIVKLVSIPDFDSYALSEGCCRESSSKG